jgi:hypothetical protein
VKNGEQRKVGNATVVCSVLRGSFVRREDKWMGRCAPRTFYSRTTYRVVGADGRQVASLVEGYANAVKIAEAL